MSLSVNISLCCKSYLISLQIMLMQKFEVYKTTRNRTFAKPCMLCHIAYFDLRRLIDTMGKLAFTIQKIQLFTL